MTDHQRQASWPADETPAEGTHEASEDTLTGAALAVSGVAALFLWSFIVNFFVLGFRSEQVHDHCLHAVVGKHTYVNYSTFPTQMFCETADDRYAAGFYPFWVSAGYSSVFVVLGLVVLYGLWMIVRRDKNAPQPAP